MASGGARNFCVAVCVVLLLASARYVLAQRKLQALPWEIFNNEVRLTARGTVALSAIDIAAAGMKKELAEVVLASIVGKVEPGSGFPISSFGFHFAVVVWSAGIPPDLQGIFTLGEEAVIGPQHVLRLAKKGAVTSEGCPRGAVAQTHPLGAFGLPCETGASLLIEQATRAGAAVNCLVMYTYSNWSIRSDKMLSMFEEALKSSQREEPRLRIFNPDFGAKVDLTLTVAFFFREAQTISRQDSTRMRVFTGAAFIPSTVSVRDMDVSNQVGLACPHGGLFLKQVPVPLLGINLNLPPEVYLYAIAFGPFPSDSSLS